MLVHAASQALGTEEIPSIIYSDDGGYNRIFLLDFPAAGKKVVARVPMKNARLPCRIAPAVATMSFSRHVLGIPAPLVYAWNASDDNPVGAPYILQEYIEGVVEPWRLFGSNGNDEQRAHVIDELAQWHARFLTPLPPHLNRVGDLAFATNVDPSTADLADPFTYIIQPLHTRLARPPEAEPKAFRASSTSLLSLWDELLACRWNLSLSGAAPGASKPNIDRVELDLGSALLEDGDRECSFDSFSTAAHDARTFIHHTLSHLRSSSPRYSSACLVRTDYAFRNVLLDSSSLRVKAFIDWDDVYAMPFSLAVNFPEDFMEYKTGGLPSDAPFYQEGYFPELPPEEYGEITGPLDKDGNLTSIDADGNPTYVDDRDLRITNTMWRDTYVRALSKYDERVRGPDFWALRKDVSKAHTFVKYGGQDWWWRRKWLAAQVAKQRERL